ncbi:cytochrome c oxidase subunit 7B, mitochondrial [Anguilla anguilla]|uniref:Cytochrome c oxidase subunit 7B, mitochondrial n=1 Tax=Anguilla anguilla TaxID=7936 RepID=A0A9D3RVI8_ANGAN|nr:cytochrome c oxidase subunit 7B, mitochondrial [Anguilla anguilla]KAG5843236.1 hypothetical protein ANANG_G00148590 [Anguilla anguilla]
MFRFTKAALNIAAQGARRVTVRHGSQNAAPNFHEKYGNILMVAGAGFCVAVWSYVFTQTGITWNLSPVGKVTPRPWRGVGGQEEEEE